MITIGIYDRHKIVREALNTMLNGNQEFNVISLDSNPMFIVDRIKSEGINIVLINIHEAIEESFKLIKNISQRFERVRVLVMSASANEQLIVRSLRSGAKGFIACEAEVNELNEAIYTLRNGYDYYSKSIAHLLVGKYINGMLGDKQTPGIEQLSSRQIEIIKLWGNNKSNKEIADQLFLSVRTVESHKNHIMQKLNLKSTVDMIKFGIRNNIIEL